MLLEKKGFRRMDRGQHRLNTAGQSRCDGVESSDGLWVEPCDSGTCFQPALRHRPASFRVIFIPRAGALCLFLSMGPSRLPLPTAHQYGADLELSCVIISLSAASPALAL